MGAVIQVQGSRGAHKDPACDRRPHADGALLVQAPRIVHTNSPSSMPAAITCCQHGSTARRLGIGVDGSVSARASVVWRSVIA